MNDRVSYAEDELSDDTERCGGLRLAWKLSDPRPRPLCGEPRGSQRRVCHPESVRDTGCDQSKQQVEPEPLLAAERLYEEDELSDDGSDPPESVGRGSFLKE